MREFTENTPSTPTLLPCVCISQGIQEPHCLARSKTMFRSPPARASPIAASPPSRHADAAATLGPPRSPHPPHDEPGFRPLPQYLVPQSPRHLSTPWIVLGCGLTSVSRINGIWYNFAPEKIPIGLLPVPILFAPTPIVNSPATGVGVSCAV